MFLQIMIDRPDPSRGQGDREGRPYHTRLLCLLCPCMVRATLAVAPVLEKMAYTLVQTLAFKILFNASNMPPKCVTKRLVFDLTHGSIPTKLLLRARQVKICPCFDDLAINYAVSAGSFNTCSLGSSTENFWMRF